MQYDSPFSLKRASRGLAVWLGGHKVQVPFSVQLLAQNWTSTLPGPNGLSWAPAALGAKTHVVSVKYFLSVD